MPFLLFVPPAIPRVPSRRQEKSRARSARVVEYLFKPRFLLARGIDGSAYDRRVRAECKIKTCNVNAPSRHIESHPPSFDPSSKCTLGSLVVYSFRIPFHPPSINPPGDGSHGPLPRPRQFSMSRITRCRFLFFSFSAERAEFSGSCRERRASGPRVYAAGKSRGSGYVVKRTRVCEARAIDALRHSWHFPPLERYRTKGVLINSIRLGIEPRRFFLFSFFFSLSSLSFSFLPSFLPFFLDLYFIIEEFPI